MNVSDRQTDRRQTETAIAYSVRELEFTFANERQFTTSRSLKTELAQKKRRCMRKSVKAVWEEEVELLGIGFVKEVDFKAGVKERGSYG